MSPVSDEYPCKFFHLRGFCYNDEGCRFSHEALTDDTRQIIEFVRYIILLFKFQIFPLCNRFVYPQKESYGLKHPVYISLYNMHHK